VLPRCQIQALPWGELEGALETGQAEALISGLAMTAESRRNTVSRAPIWPCRRGSCCAGEAGSGEDNAAALAGKRIGVLESTAHEVMLRDWFSEIRPVTFTRSEWMFDALKAGNIDAVFGDGLQLSFWLSSQLGGELLPVFWTAPIFPRPILGKGWRSRSDRATRPLAKAFDHALAALNQKRAFCRTLPALVPQRALLIRDPALAWVETGRAGQAPSRGRPVRLSRHSDSPISIPVSPRRGVCV
jgi:polar amino acid transport system substrate-binding protein